MKKLILVLSLLLPFLFSSAQSIDFTEANPQPNLIEIYSGDIDSGDIDGDGDNDLIMSGIDPGKRTVLYLNDGSGNFTEIEDSPFPKASESVCIFEDLDLDGDLDLFFSGNGFGIQEFTHIYLNDGLGTFTQSSSSSLPSFADSGVALVDVDGDGDPDLLISVKDANDNWISDVFLNDGSATFSPSGSTAFTEVQFGAVTFIDVENDGDADVIISGKQEDGLASTKLYLNDGTGNFNFDNNMNFLQLIADDIDVADTDGDGDLDILISGQTDAFEIQTILYLNDGFGQFNPLASANLQNTSNGTNAISDLDNDGDQDIIIIGSQAGGLPNIYTIVYENMNNNVFVPSDTLGGEYIAAAVVDDFNSDGLVDLIIQGFVAKTTVYWNTKPSEVSLSVILEGAFDGGTNQMRTVLANEGLLPLDQRYGVAPYNYMGTESTLGSAITGVVDWVLVEARIGPTNVSKVDTKAGLLLSNGNIVGTDGTSPLFFDLPANSDVYFVVRHRNHLDVMTASSLPRSLDMAYDFTSIISNAFGQSQQNLLTNGQAAMIPADISQDHIIQVTDYDQWQSNPALLDVYDSRDLNLDGTVQVTDYDLWFENKAKIGPSELAY